MKKFAHYAFTLAAFAGLSVFTGCTSEEETEIVDPSPSVTIPQEAPTTGKVGQEIKFDIAVVAEAKIKSIETRFGTITLGTVKTTDFTNATSDKYPFAYTPIDADAGKKLDFSVIVIDKKERQVKKDFSITIEAEGSIRTQTAKLLYGQSNTTGGSFYATEGTGMEYTQVNAKTNAAKIDFLYFYGSENKATLAAPSDADAKTIYNNANNGLQTWSKLNGTKFKEVTMAKAQFDAVTYAAINTSAEGATASKTNMLIADKVVAFITDGGLKGLIYVNSITGTDSGSINITIKIQDAVE